MWGEHQKTKLKWHYSTRLEYELQQKNDSKRGNRIRVAAGAQIGLAIKPATMARAASYAKETCRPCHERLAPITTLNLK